MMAEAKKETVVKVKLPIEQEAALTKLDRIKGCHKSEVVALAVDLFLSRPADEIVTMVRQWRDTK
ncbi:MAG: hypothetical protein SA339_13835 [Methanomassiliicoccus sp.]|nr:hypothetical protein [Methanomassiliicoccus sp.]